MSNMTNNTNHTNLVNNNGKLIIDTYPSDAKIFVNQKHVGNSPIEITDVSDDRYYYAISKEGYSDYENEIYVRSNKISHVFVNLDTREYQVEYVDTDEQLTDFLKIYREEKEEEEKERETTPVSPVENLLTKLIDNTSYLIDINSKIDQKLEAISLWSEMMMTSVHRRLRYDNYYNVINTIVAGDGGGFSSTALDIDSPIYFVDNIHQTLERNAEVLNVHNQSKTSIYVRVSHSGQAIKTIEEEIVQGKVKTYYNIYDVRCRSPLLGATYEITEYDITDSSDPKLVPLEKATIENVDTTAGVNILPSDLTPINSPAMFIVYVVLGVPGIFYYRLTTAAISTLIMLNLGADLQELSLYRFQIPVHTGDSINFATSVTGTGGIVTMLRVQETDAAIF